MMRDPLALGSTIGILGGGQLGRMLSVAAARLGFKTHIFEPGANPPAGHVADAVTTAAYDDHAALRAFAQTCDVVTFEFENVPTEALDLIETLVAIRPGREALRISQDRLTEKTFLQGLGLAVAPFADVPDAEALQAAVATIGTPASRACAALKTRKPRWPIWRAPLPFSKVLSISPMRFQ
jgi:5-(carboxyamino)imidazole ribonucleotide synthase